MGGRTWIEDHGAGDGAWVGACGRTGLLKLDVAAFFTRSTSGCECVVAAVAFMTLPLVGTYRRRALVVSDEHTTIHPTPQFARILSGLNLTEGVPDTGLFRGCTLVSA